MKSKDQILLEKAYLQILKEQEDKFQPHDPEMQAMSQKGLGEEFPEDQIEEPPTQKLEWIPDPKNPNRSLITKQTFNIDGNEAFLKSEEQSTDDDMWTDLYFIDSKTGKELKMMNWGRGDVSYQEVLDYIKIGQPKGVLTPQNVRVNLNSDLLKKFKDGTAEKEGFKLIK
jgi:hypothetical protein